MTTALLHTGRGPRELCLDISALTDTEYAAYTEWYRFLYNEAMQDRGASLHARSGSLSPTLTREIVQEFALNNLGVDLPAFVAVCKLIQVPSSPHSELSMGRVLALFRVLSHEWSQPQSLSQSLVFLPSNPRPVRVDFEVSTGSAASNTRSKARTVSGPASSSNGTRGPALDSPHSASDLNPFRGRPVMSSLVSVPPPLPPRKQSQPVQISGPISPDCQNSLPPTSTSRPSYIIRRSLEAAQQAQSSSPSRPAHHVIKRSESVGIYSRSLRSRDIVEHVKSALTESENHAQTAQSIKCWDCRDILDPQLDADQPGQYAMIIVNQPIKDVEILTKAWQSSALRLCADGGANRLYDLFPDDMTRSKYLPDMIKGDLDSLRSDVHLFYKYQGVTIVQDRDEYSTDLQKCIQVVKEREVGQLKEFRLLLVGGLSGRIDQTIHTITVLHKLRKSRDQAYVLSGESLAWVLDQGSHQIHVDHATMGQTCGILPVGVGSANVRTEGLEWNLDWSTSFDGEISTSNHLLPSQPIVWVHTDAPILWCVEVRNAST